MRINIVEALKNDFEHFVGGFIEVIYFLRVGVLEREETSEFCEGAHDGDVDIDGAVGVENSRKHGHAVFGEGVREIFSIC